MSGANPSASIDKDVSENRAGGSRTRWTGAANDRAIGSEEVKCATTCGDLASHVISSG